MSRRPNEYRKVWEDFHGKKLPKGMHIHHIDGNHQNNSPENLLACTPEEHWQIHFDRGDTVALRGKFIQLAHTKKLKGKDHPMYGKRGSDNPNYGKKRPKEAVDAQTGTRSPTYKHGLKSKVNHFYCKCGKQMAVGYSKVCNQCKSIGGRNHKAKKVHCEMTGKTWECIKDAASDLNIKPSTLRAWLNPNNPNPNKTWLRYK